MIQEKLPKNIVYNNNNYENYIPTNTQENQPKNSIITPKRKEVNISYPNNQNSPLNQENCNLNTLESVMIRNINYATSFLFEIIFLLHL